MSEKDNLIDARVAVARARANLWDVQLKLMDAIKSAKEAGREDIANEISKVRDELNIGDNGLSSLIDLLWASIS